MLLASIKRSYTHLSARSNSIRPGSPIPNRYRPDHCPQCEAKRPLAGHGFYHRTLADVAFEGVIRVRRYLCRRCKRTVDQPCSEDQAGQCEHKALKAAVAAS